MDLRRRKFGWAIVLLEERIVEKQDDEHAEEE